MSSESAQRAGGTQRIPTTSRRRSAGEPAWHGLPVNFNLSSVLEKLATHAQCFTAVSNPPKDEWVSAVLVLLTQGNNGTEILLTRRATHLSSHSGEISFPGGRVEQGETIISAALRETYEEVGIDASLITKRTELSALSTIVSKSFIVPVVATIQNKPELTLSVHEVERAWWVPLADLVGGDTFVWEWWSSAGGQTSGEHPMFFFYLDDETVWGATARMIHELLCIVFDISHLELPKR